VEEYNQATRNGRHLSGEEVKSLMRIALDEPQTSASEIFEHGKPRSFGKKQVTPKNATQKHYMEQIEAHDMVFGIGPGGTGKPISPWPWPSARFSRSKSTASFSRARRRSG